MRFTAKMDGVEHKVAASPDGALSIGSESHRAEVTRTTALRRSVRVGDKTLEVRFIETDSDPSAPMTKRRYVSSEVLRCMQTTSTPSPTIAVAACQVKK